MKRASVFLLFFLAMQSAFANDTNLTLTVDGITYSNVTFGTVSPSSVSVRHSTGATSILLEKLPSDLQKRFGYDPKVERERMEKLQADQRAWAERKRKEEEEGKQPLTGKDLTAWKLARQSAEYTFQNMLPNSVTARCNFSDSLPLKRYMRKNAIGDYEFLFVGRGTIYNISGVGLAQDMSVVVTVTEIGDELRVVPAKGNKPW